ncbi:hypothetical protein [Pontivivens insulae]|nr:hypothetical protein [Pontivivens insulae]
MRKGLVRATLALALAAAPLSAQDGPARSTERQSPLEWLTREVATQPRPRPTVEQDRLRSYFGAVEEQPLPGLTTDALGLLPSRITGLPVTLWGDAPAGIIATLLRNIKNTGVPASRHLFNRILLAEARPPQGPPGLVLGVRIERLLDTGALDAAEAMLNRAEQPDLQVTELAFDIGVLTGRDDRVCSTLLNQTELAPNVESQIWCAARLGRWHEAAFLYRIATALEEIDPIRADHLAWFLDPEMFETGFELDVPEALTPLDFALREAIGQPRPPGTLPLAYLDGDLSGNRTLRARIEAAEALVQRGDLPPPVLFATYRRARPAASGGLWGRSGAVQDLDDALRIGSVEEIIAAVEAVDEAFAPLGLRQAAAREFAVQLADLPADAPNPTLAAWFLLDNKPGQARDWMRDEELTLIEALSIAILEQRRIPPPAIAPRTDRERRALAAYSAFAAPEPPGADLSDPRQLVADEQVGEAILRALRVLDAGTEIEFGDLHAVLAALAPIQPEIARRIAIETLWLTAPL